MTRLQAARLRRQLKRPTPELQSVVRRLRARLPSAPGAALALVEIDVTEAAAMAIAALVRQLATEGQQVVVADAADGRPLRALLRASGATGDIQMAEVNGQPVGLVVAPADPARLSAHIRDEDPDVVLVLATVNPAFGAGHLAAWARDAVVMLRAGATTKPHIESVATQLRYAGITVCSGILVGSDRQDHTSGVPTTCGSAPVPAEDLLETLKAASQ